MMLLARNLSAGRVNLLSGDFSSGLPGPFAFLGLAASMAPALGFKRWEIGVLPILHHVSQSHGRTRTAYVKKADRFAASESPEDMTGDVMVSIAFDFPSFCQPTELEELLKTRRIAGGGIATAIPDIEELTPGRRPFDRVDRGYAMIRPSEEKALRVAVGEDDDLLHIASLLYDEEPGRPIRSATTVGHHLLEDPRNPTRRRGVRDPEVPHVFSEPAVGISELVSVRSSRFHDLTGTDIADLFWRYDSSGSWIFAHPCYRATLA